MAVQRAAESESWQVLRLSSWRVPSEFASVAQDVTAYGEPLFVAAIAEHLNLVLIEPQFSWLSELPPFYTKRKVELTTLAQARNFPSEVFAKPADDKCFAAGVYQSGLVIEASKLLPESTPVILSEVVQWEVECRYFILERAVMCWSPYSFNGELLDASFVESNSDAAERARFVQDLLNDLEIDLPPAVVIDVGKIRERGWAVVEANPVFGSGIYSCDPIKVLPVLARSIVPAHTVSQSDKKWIIQRDYGFSAARERIDRYELSAMHSTDEWLIFFQDCTNLLDHPEEAVKQHAIDRLQKGIWSENIQEYRQPGFKALSAEARLVPILNAIAKQDKREWCLLCFSKWSSLSADQKNVLSRWLAAAESEGTISSDTVTTVQIDCEIFSVEDWNEAKVFLERCFEHSNDQLRASAAEAFGKMYLSGAENLPPLSEVFEQIKNWEIERPGFAGSFLGQIMMSSEILQELEECAISLDEWILGIIRKRKGEEPHIQFHNGIDFYAHEILSRDPAAVRKLMYAGAEGIAAMAATEEDYPIAGMQVLLEQLAFSADDFVSRICSWHLAAHYRYLHPEAVKRKYVELVEREEVIVFLVFNPEEIGERPYAATIYPSTGVLSDGDAWKWIDKLVPPESRPRMEDNKWTDERSPQIDSGSATYVYGAYIFELFGNTESRQWDRVWVKWPLLNIKW